MDQPVITDPDAERGEVEPAEELPVVARLVVEIRSDGSRTIARGAIEDRLNGEQVGVEAQAGSPLELSRALVEMVLSAPFTALLGRGKPSSRRPGESLGSARDDEPGPRSGTGVRARVGALGRKLGRRIDSSLRARLRGRGGY